MIRKRTLGFLSLLVGCSILLTACGGEVYARSYMASGDGLNETDLTADEQFSGTDDLNVVVKLNRHGETANIEARFIDPNGDVLEAITAEAPEEVGTVVLGIDFEARDDQGNEWLSGRYRVEIVIDDELVDTLFFRVS